MFVVISLPFVTLRKRGSPLMTNAIIKMVILESDEGTYTHIITLGIHGDGGNTSVDVNETPDHIVSARG